MGGRGLRRGAFHRGERPSARHGGWRAARALPALGSAPQTGPLGPPHSWYAAAGRTWMSPFPGRRPLPPWPAFGIMPHSLDHNDATANVRGGVRAECAGREIDSHSSPASRSPGLLSVQGGAQGVAKRTGRRPCKRYISNELIQGTRTRRRSNAPALTAGKRRA